MSTIVGATLVIILAAISAIHVYWAAGGRWGMTAVLPQQSEGSGERAFTPSALMTLAVALAMFAASALVAMRAGLVPRGPVPPSWLTAGTGLLGAVFALRAIGDFRLVGLFKRVKGTPFARADSALFTPLCLALSAGCALVALS